MSDFHSNDISTGCYGASETSNLIPVIPRIFVQTSHEFKYNISKQSVVVDSSCVHTFPDLNLK